MKIPLIELQFKSEVESFLSEAEHTLRCLVKDVLKGDKQSERLLEKIGPYLLNELKKVTKTSSVGETERERGLRQ